MRYPSIDILRTVAIFVMVLVHFGENLSGYHLPIAGFGAPLFAFLSGVSYFLWSQGRLAQGMSETDVSKISVRRGLFVFGVGIAFNILVWLPEDTFNWDVLTFIGVSLLVLNFARRSPVSVLSFAILSTILVSPLLRALANYDAYWSNNYFDGDSTLSDVLIGFLATGYFPFFPWIAFSLTGLVAAAWLFSEADQSVESLTGTVTTEATQPPVWPVVFGGASFLLLSLAALNGATYLPPVVATQMLGGFKMFPPTLEYVLGMLGWTLVLFGGGHYFVDRNSRLPQFENALSITKTFSQYSFTIYVLHHVVHLWPLWIYSIATGNEPTYYWMKAMPATLSLPLAILFLASCYIILRWLGPDRAYGIEAGMRWLCD